MRHFDELVVAITGGNRGIGAATAVEVASQGAQVHICGRTSEELRAVASQSPRIEAMALDIRDERAVQTWMERIKKGSGRLDVLINNAGVLGPKKRLGETEVQAFRQTIDVNVVGTFVVIRAAYPLLKAAEEPLMINLSSSVGRRGRASWGAYSISKFAVEGLSEVAADELSEVSGCVVSLNPGGTATEMRAEAYPDEDPATLPEPREVAATIRLLIRVLGPEQNGGKYSSRDLFDYVERSVEPADLPREG